MSERWYLSLTKWLSDLGYSEPKKESANQYVAHSDLKGSILIRTINRKSYQPHVNCVDRDSFEKHKAIKSQRGLQQLVYVISLHGNKQQLFVPQDVVEREIATKWLVVPLKEASLGKPPLQGITVLPL